MRETVYMETAAKRTKGKGRRGEDGVARALGKQTEIIWLWRAARGSQSNEEARRPARDQRVVTVLRPLDAVCRQKTLQPSGEDLRRVAFLPTDGGASRGLPTQPDARNKGHAMHSWDNHQVISSTAPPNRHLDPKPP
ncbi:hypothetical protein VTN02DRAFT_1890 [Thermoascus thermophilus]